MKRIGIFGGSFSPVHHGHLLAAREAFERLGLDELVFVPCGQSAYGKKLLPGALRLKLLKGSLAGAKGFAVSDLEVRRQGVSRSIDTLRALKAAAAKGSRFYLLIGSDQVAAFPSWKEAAELARLAQVCVLARPGVKAEGRILKKFDMRRVDIAQYEISSSAIAQRLKKKLPVDWLLPAYVVKHLFDK